MYIVCVCVSDVFVYACVYIHVKHTGLCVSASDLCSRASEDCDSLRHSSSVLVDMQMQNMRDELANSPLSLSQQDNKDTNALFSNSNLEVDGLLTPVLLEISEKKKKENILPHDLI